MSFRTAVILGLGFFGCAVLTAFLSGPVVEISGAYSEELPSNPYFVADAVVGLYFLLPLFVLASVVFLLGPGILLVLVTVQGTSLSEILLRGLGAALVYRFVVHSLLKLTTGEVITRQGFLTIEFATIALLWILLMIRARARADVPPILKAEADQRRLLWCLSLPVLLTISLLPILFWQDMTDDGLEALESGASLAHYVWPRFTSGNGLMGLGAGLVTMAHPVHWYVLLLGPIEAAGRLPLALYLPVLFVGLLWLIEWKSARSMGGSEEAVLLVALAAFVATMSYNASYDPYAADVAAPAASETLTLLCMVGMLASFWSRSTFWALLFTILAYFARPTGLLFLGLVGLTTIALVPEERRWALGRTAICVGALLLTYVLYEKVFITRVAGSDGIGYPSSTVVSRLRYITLDDFQRILYVAVPSGILPFLSLFFLRRQDSVTRSLSAVVLLYFLFFYVQAFVAHHHFVPAMILPLVVFWRLVVQAPVRRWLYAATLVAAVASLWLSLPNHFEVYRGVRELGRATVYRIGDYNGPLVGHRVALSRRNILYELFPPDWEVEDPAREQIGVPLGHLYYASADSRITETVNYVVQSPGTETPLGFTKVAETKDGMAFVRDRELWERDRHRWNRTDYRSPVYAISRETLFQHIGAPAENYTLDLRNVPLIGRFF